MGCSRLWLVASGAVDRLVKALVLGKGERCHQVGYFRIVSEGATFLAVSRGLTGRVLTDLFSGVCSMIARWL